VTMITLTEPKTAFAGIVLEAFAMFMASMAAFNVERVAFDPRGTVSIVEVCVSCGKAVRCGGCEGTPKP
jgi:hypothetical protein